MYSQESSDGSKEDTQLPEQPSDSAREGMLHPDTKDLSPPGAIEPQIIAPGDEAAAAV